jgi:hypothetical protein
MARTILILTVVAFLVFTGQGRGREGSAAEDFSPEVSVAITDGAPLSHPDIITTIDIPRGPLLARVRTLTPLGGSVAGAEDIPDGTFVGWISGFIMIPGPDGACDQRSNFDLSLNTAPVDPTLMPPYLREADPGPHVIRFATDAGPAQVNMIFDQVQIEGETRLVISTYIGDPTVPSSPTCAPFRARVTMNGMAGTTPVITTPPAAEPQVHEFTLTSLPDANGDVHEVKRTVALVVQPALQTRIEGDEIRWNALPDAASYRAEGGVIYDAPCEQVRRLIIREESRRFDTDLASSDTSMAFPPPSDPTLERTAVDFWVSAYDSDDVLLARQFVNWVRDWHTCWYAPGTEPLMSVEPASGDCDGEVTFRGSRFPTDVRVEIAIIPYGTDSPSGFVGTSTVAPDGTFALTTRLPTSACWLATRAPQGAVYLAAYNVDQPKLDGSFASTQYFTAVPQGAVFFVAAPATGTGPIANGMSWPLLAAFALAFAGAASVGGGLILFTRMRAFRRAV